MRSALPSVAGPDGRATIRFAGVDAPSIKFILKPDASTQVGRQMDALGAPGRQITLNDIEQGQIISCAGKVSYTRANVSTFLQCDCEPALMSAG